MSFISYAQNFEDVMLWRALKHIEQGFFIDVGAAWADEHSVTKAFYENGWRGINIEPNPEFHEQLEASRPRDVNLKVAVGDAKGVMAMNFLANTGLSTLDDAIAGQHQAAGWDASRREVEVKTLAAIWQQHVPDGQPVHFLKVDVEGFEEAVLRGNEWARYRPWVVVVEATLPMSQVDSYTVWEPILLESGYQFAYADGLNRFYVAQEHADLLAAFKYPPNVFDEFVLAAHQQAQARAQESEARAQQAENAAQQAQARAQESEARAQQAEAVLTSIINSRSWRITKPLRLLANGLRRLRNGGKQALKSVLRPILGPAIRFISARPRLKRPALAWARKHPRLEERLRRLAAARGLTGDGQVDARSNKAHPPPMELAHLTPRARQIYADLKAAIEKNHKEAA